MKIVLLILGIAMFVFGILLTAWTWYDAAGKGRISEASAYAGPVLIILGLLRMIRAAAAVPLPSFARVIVVGIAILAGYGNSAAVKAAFPQAQLEVSTTTH